MANKKLYVTIDTEMDADVQWRKNLPPEFTSIYYGIPHLLRPLWDRYNVHPVYFLSPEILNDDKCCEIFRCEIQKGAIIGAHLHPEFIEPEMIVKYGGKTITSQFPCFDCSYEVEKEKIKNLTDVIEKKLGVRPLWYRAARFGADDDTYKILDELGYEYESSVTPGIDWSDSGGVNYKNYPNQKYNIKGLGLTELPVTIAGKRWRPFGRLLPDRWLFYRWMRPSHMTFFEMKRLIIEQEKKGNTDLVMMFHSMEVMINKTPYVRFKWMQKYYLWRLKKVLEFASVEGYSM